MTYPSEFLQDIGEKWRSLSDDYDGEGSYCFKKKQGDGIIYSCSIMSDCMDWLAHFWVTFSFLLHMMSRNPILTSPWTKQYFCPFGVILIPCGIRCIPRSHCPCHGVAYLHNDLLNSLNLQQLMHFAVTNKLG